MMAFMVDTEEQTMRAPIGLAIILYEGLPKPLKANEHFYNSSFQ